MDFPKIPWYIDLWYKIKSYWPRCRKKSVEGRCLNPMFHKGPCCSGYFVWDKKGVYRGTIAQIEEYNRVYRHSN